MIKIEVVPSVDIEIGGEERKLRYTHAAWAALEKELQIENYSDLLGRLQDEKARFSAVEFNALLWCGFLHESPELTSREVGGWFRTADIPAIAPVILEALVKQLPEADGKKKQ